MFRICLVALAAENLIFGATAFAQVGGYNPYAVPHDEPPVSQDGKLNWSTFYKSAQIQANYERLYELGACGNTNKRITIPVEQNKLDINTLPEGTVQGEIVKVGKGLVAIVDKEKRGATVVLHPAGVTRVGITGPIAATALKKGMNVRFEGSVDQHGHGSESLVKLDVISLPANYKPTKIKLNSMETIVGQVIDVRESILHVRVRSGTLSRLTLTLQGNAVANIDASDIELAAPGDTIEVKGHLWDGSGSKIGPAVFASDITIKRPLSPNHEPIAQAN